MEILFVAPEIAPTIKASALGEAVFALSKALRNLGHKVTVALPRWAAFDASGLLVARRLTPMPIAGDGPVREVTLFDSRLATGVELVLFDAAHPKSGGSLYGDVVGPEGANLYDRAGAPHPDTALRAAVLCRAAVELAKQRAAAGQPFDAIHAHDGWAAMALYLAKLAPELAATKLVLTIHDLAKQALFTGDDARAALAVLELGADHMTPARLEFYGGLSFLKGGALAADAVTTLSDTYARELVTTEGGGRLAGVLAARPTPPLGVLHGVDASVFNPATDAPLAARYDADDPSNKGRCKSALAKELGLAIAPERPMFVVVGNLGSTQGSDVLAEALPKLLLRDVAVVIVATNGPDAALEERLRAACALHPDRAALVVRATDARARQTLAAGDFALLPARFEPGAHLALAAGRYGAVPVASRTGGHLDAVVDADAELETGNGFLFELGSADALLGAVGRAEAAWSSPHFAVLRRRVMRRDSGWERPARRYAQLYRSSPAASTTA